METNKKQVITVQAEIKVPVETAWKVWTSPEYILKWNQASDDWQTSNVANDLKAGGKFSYRMEAKDGSVGFDFYGTYDKVVENKLIEYTLGDDRKVKIVFTSGGKSTHITESFEAEGQNPPELQQKGWQAILNNYKKVAESV